MKVLIVDDESLICESIKADFQRMEHPWEYEVFTAKSVTTAQEIYYCEEPDVVITDVNMPGGSGLILVSEIHKANPDCGLLVLSAYDDFEYVRNAFTMGAWDYILKLIAFVELENCVRNLAEKISAGKESYRSDNDYDTERQKGVFGIEDVEDYIREHTGMSFSSYLLWQRMECAKEYLENSHMKIKQVASKVCYRDNPQHFSRDFTRQVGMSPKEYRAQIFGERK